MGLEWSGVLPPLLNGFGRSCTPTLSKQLSFTLHSEDGPGADLPGTVPGLTGVCACVLREHLLDTQAVPATLLLEVEVLRLLDLIPVVKPDDFWRWVP